MIEGNKKDIETQAWFNLGVFTLILSWGMKTIQGSPYFFIPLICSPYFFYKAWKRFTVCGEQR